MIEVIESFQSGRKSNSPVRKYSSMRGSWEEIRETILALTPASIEETLGYRSLRLRSLYLGNLAPSIF